MKYIDEYELYRNSEELPETAKEKLSDFFLQRFTGRTADLFVEMARDLPRTFAAIQSSFSEPHIGIKLIAGRPKVDLVFKAEGRCLVGSPLTPLFYDLYDFDEIYAMLPKPIRSYYKVTFGLQIVADSAYAGLGWLDLPLDLAVRMSLREAAEHLQLNGDYFRDVPAPRQSRVWMVSERDLLIVDEKTGTFYHSDVSQPTDVFELNDPVGIWDNYCAHVLSGDSDEPFDFRNG